MTSVSLVGVVSVFGGEGSDTPVLIDALATMSGRAPRRGPSGSLRTVNIEAEKKTPVALIEIDNEPVGGDNCIAGVAQASAALFVVTPNGGWSDNLQATLELCQLVGLDRAAVIITASESQSSDMELLKKFIEEQLADTAFAGSKITHVDPTHTEACSNALSLIRELAGAPKPKRRKKTTSPARMWVHMSYVVGQAGTVVTGIVEGGAFCLSDPVVISPGSLKGNIKALQTNKGTQVDVGPHEFVAMNLNDVDHRDVSKGNALLSTDGWNLTTTVECSITAAKSAKRPLTSDYQYRAYVGLSQYPVRVKIISSSSVLPGGTGVAQLTFPVALPLRADDRVLIRDLSNDQLVGGGVD